MQIYKEISLEGTIMIHDFLKIHYFAVFLSFIERMCVTMTDGS